MCTCRNVGEDQSNTSGGPTTMRQQRPHRGNRSIAANSRQRARLKVASDRLQSGKRLISEETPQEFGRDRRANDATGVAGRSRCNARFLGRRQHGRAFLQHGSVNTGQDPRCIVASTPDGFGDNQILTRSLAWLELRNLGMKGLLELQLRPRHSTNRQDKGREADVRRRLAHLQ